MNFRKTLKSIGIIPVIQINDAEKAVPLALALKKGGLPAAEVTFRTDAAEEAIRRIKIEVPDVCVCAGTVLNVKTAERAVKAGASAIISAQNAAEYLALPNVLCCGGSWMVPGGLLDAGDFDAIEALAREAAQIVKK